jgi:hypothetical protein
MSGTRAVVLVLAAVVAACLARGLARKRREGQEDGG